MNLGLYIRDFTANNIPYLPLKWPSDASPSGDMFSVLVQVPHTQVIFEIVSGPYSGSWPQPQQWIELDYTRVPTAAITANRAYYADETVLTPVAVSKATSSMASTQWLEPWTCGVVLIASLRSNPRVGRQRSTRTIRASCRAARASTRAPAP
jgi:hypothetical protein